MQRSLGLELSCLKPLFDASAARGLTVTQSARLGDEVLLNANNTARHNAGLSVVHSALSQLTAATLPASHLALGDRGDGTPASKEEAKRRHADLNEGHVPDLYRRGVPTWLGEYKCYSWVVSTAAVNHGTGTVATGGGASTADGWLFARGGTEERLTAQVLGLAARGPPTGPPLDRQTGAGRVLRRDGHYADALAKGHRVTLFASETSGAVSPSFDALLQSHDRLARSPGTVDHTTYGLSTSNTRSYRRHYLAWHSHVVVLADADTLLLAAETLGRALARPATAA